MTIMIESMSEKKFEFMTGHMKNDLGTSRREPDLIDSSDFPVEVEINGKKQYGGWTGTHKEEEDQWLSMCFFQG